MTMPTEDAVQAAAGTEPATEAAPGVQSRPAGGSATFTQEDIDKAVKGRLDRAKAKYEKENGALRADIEAKEAELADLRAKASAYEREREVAGWAREVSDATGVKAELLRGSTKEELQAHAEAIAAAYGTPSVPVVQSDGFAPAKGASMTNSERFAEALDGIL